jgi:hypothetical protein
MNKIVLVASNNPYLKSLIQSCNLDLKNNYKFHYIIQPADIFNYCKKKSNILFIIDTDFYQDIFYLIQTILTSFNTSNSRALIIHHYNKNKIQKPISHKIDIISFSNLNKKEILEFINSNNV